MEKWVDILSYNGDYQVSSTGKIKSVKSKNLVLKQSIDRDGYKQVVLSSNGVLKTFKVHRLVAISFIENPHEMKQVNHIDGNKTNNNVDNLEWCTASQNIKHSYNKLKRIPSCGMKGKVGFWKGKTGKNHFSSKLVYQYSLDDKLIKVWDSAISTLKEGFNNSKVSMVCRGERIIHKGFKWSYTKK